MGVTFIVPLTEEQQADKLKSDAIDLKFQAVNNAIAAESDTRLQADSEIHIELEGIRNDLTGETALRVADVAALNDALNIESDTRFHADSDLTVALNAEIAARNAAEGQIRNELSTAVGAEENARMKADSDLKTALIASMDDRFANQQDINEALDEDIKAAINERNSALSQIRADLNSEITVRTTDINDVNYRIETEINDRKAAINSEHTFTIATVGVESTARVSDVTVLRAEIAQEARERGSDVTAIHSAIGAEERARENAINQLSSNLSNEVTNRTNAINTINNNISAINNQLSAEFNDFTQDRHGYVPKPPSDSDAEHILVAGRKSKVYGWRPVTASTAYISAVPFQSNTLTFNGNNQSPTWQNYDPNKLQISGTTGNQRNAGTYNATFTPKDIYLWGDDLNQAAKNAQWKIEILKINQPSAWKDKFDYAAGTTHRINLYVSNFDTTWISASGDTEKSEPGTYTAVYSLNDKNNVNWADGTTGDVTIHWEIEQKALAQEFSTFSVDDRAFIYDDGKTYYAADCFSNYRAEYHVLTGNTEASAAGTYTVKIKPQGAYTWFDGTTTEKPFEWHIRGKTTTTPAATQTSFGYTGSDVSVLNYINGFDTKYAEIQSDSVTVASDTGDYTVTFVIKSAYAGSVVFDDDNKTSIKISWSIGKTPIPAKFSGGFAQEGTLTYNGNEQTPTIKNLDLENYHDIAWATLNKIAGTNAQTYTLAIKPKPQYRWADGTTGFSTDSSDYAPERTPKGDELLIRGIIRIDWVIKPQVVTKPKVRTGTPISFPYDGEVHTVQIDNPDSAYCSIWEERSDALTQSAVGDYKVTYRLNQAWSPAIKIANYVWANADGSASTNVDPFEINWTIGANRVLRPALSNYEPYVFADRNYTVNYENYDSAWMDKSGVETASDVGTYKITFHLNKSADQVKWDDGSTDDWTIEWQIVRKRLTVDQSTFSITKEYTFINSDVVPEVNGFDEKYHTKSDYFARHGYVGDYNVKVDVNKNYCWNDGTTDTKLVPWSIKVGKSYTPAVSLRRGTTGAYDYLGVSMVYTGISKTADFTTVIQGYLAKNGGFIATLDTTQVDGDGEFFSCTHYKPDGSTYNPRFAFNNTDNRLVDAGVYPTVFHLTCNDNQTNATWSDGSVADITLNCEIKRAPFAKIPSQDGTLTYNGNNQTVALRDFDSDTMVLTDTTTGRNATTYTATVTPDKNHCWSDNSIGAVSIPWTIQPKIITPPTAVATEFPFDNADHELDFGDTFDSEWMQKDTSSGSTFKAKAANTYTARVKLKDTTNTRWSTGNSEPYPIEWSIGMTKVTPPTLINTTFTFIEGTRQEPQLNGFDTSTMKLSTASITNAINAGSYPITVELADSTTTVWDDGTTSPITYTWQIRRKPLSLTQSTLSFSGDLTYNSSTQSAASYIANYDPNVHSISKDYLKTDAGTYVCQIAPLSNYCWNDGTTAAKNIPWEIKVLKLAKPTISGDSVFTYDGRQHSITVNNVSAYIETRDPLTQINKGNYTVTYRLLSNTPSKINITWTDDTTGDVPLSWSIVKTTIPKPTAKATSFTYNKNEQKLDVSNFNETYLTRNGTFAATDAGNYSVTYSIKEDYKDRIEWAEDGSTGDVTINWTIERKRVYKTYKKSVNFRDIIFNGSEIDIARKTTFSYVYIYGYDSNYLGVDTIDVTGTTTASDAGIYPVTITLTNNYAWADGTYDPLETTWEIQPKLIDKPSIDLNNLPVYNGTLNNNGTEQQPPLIGYNARTMELSGETSRVTAWDGCLLYVTPLKNYAWSDTGKAKTITLRWQVLRQNLTAEESDIPDTIYLDYTGKSQNFGKALADNDITAGSYISQTHRIRYNGKTLAATKIGEYENVFWVEPNSNFNWATGTREKKYIKCVIRPKPVTPPSIANNYFDYTGSPITVTVDNPDDVPMTAGTTSATNKGSYSVTYTPAEGTGWSDTYTTEPRVLPWSIGIDGKTAVAKPRIFTKNFTYTGNARNITVYSYNANAMTENGPRSATDAGEYTITYTLRNGYIWMDGTEEPVTLTWYINKKPIPESNFAQKDALTYNGSAQIVSITNYDPSIHKISGVKSATNAGTYEAKIEPLPNFTFGEGIDSISVSWTIQPVMVKQPSVVQPDFTWTGSDITFAPVFKDGDNTSDYADYVNSLLKVGGETCVQTEGTITASDCGTYTVTYKLRNATNATNFNWFGSEHPTDDIPLQWSIQRISVKDPTPPNSDTTVLTVVCTGMNNSQKPPLEGFDSSTMVYVSTVKDKSNTQGEIVGGIEGRGVGQYITTVALKNKAGYKWADKTEKKETDDLTFKWEITPIHIGAFQDAKQTNTLIFNGNVQNPTFNVCSNIIGSGNCSEGKHALGGIYSASDASTYTATIAPNARWYSWDDGTTTPISAEWEIQPATTSWNNGAAPSRSYSFSDNRTYQTLNMTSNSPAPFVVTSSDTSIVTAEVDGNTIKLLSNKNGSTTVEIRQDATKNYTQARAVITVNVARTLESRTWTEIQQYAQNGTLLDYANIGDTKHIALSGTFGGLNFASQGGYVRLIGYNHNIAYEDEKRAHFLVDMLTSPAVDTALVNGNYNTNDTSVFSYAQLPGRTTNINDTYLMGNLQSFGDILPADLNNVITPCKKVVTNMLYSGHSTYNDKFWLLDKREIDGKNPVPAATYTKYVAQYEYFINTNGFQRYRVSPGYQRSTARDAIWWTRTWVCGGTTTQSHTFLYAYNSAKQQFDEAHRDLSLGLVIGFTIS